MPAPPEKNGLMAYLKLIECLAEAASCCRQLAFFEERRGWLAVDELLVHVRGQVIELRKASQAETPRIIQ